MKAKRCEVELGGWVGARWSGAHEPNINDVYRVELSNRRKGHSNARNVNLLLNYDSNDENMAFYIIFFCFAGRMRSPIDGRMTLSQNDRAHTDRTESVILSHNLKLKCFN